ncbi:MAG TPA: DUF3422 domain-containing protein [Pseudomonas sp.]|nr:DUF3422 domain-containing protein [Pseudomonas sp.]
MHPSRIDLHNELHARPSIYFNEPVQVFHLALVESEGALEEIIRRLHASDEDCGVQQQAHGLLELDGHEVKWERHTEFLSLTLVVPKSANAPLWPPLPAALQDAIAGHEHLLINATQILVESEQTWEGHTAGYGFQDPAGSQIGGGDAIVWSDFRLCAEGTNRLLLVNRGLNAYRLGRMVRRLLEIETYRMMASLTLPVAKELSAQLKGFDRALAALSDKNAQTDTANARLILGEIANLSAQVVRIAAKTRQRFSAADAYAQIVFERIGELRESHVGDCQLLGVFIERRFKPTVRYCSATHQRLERLGDSVANLSELLQARVQVEVEEQNSAILHSLHSRATTQIKIQKAVEGLSIIAISYYLLSLFKLFYEGLHSLGVELAPRQAALYLAPIALILIAGIALHIRKTRAHGE